jgi:hypothetical protein
MKVTDVREMWIHTHFVVDSLYMTPQEQQTISMRVEPELKQMGIQYGLHYKNAPSVKQATIVLECIPFDPIKETVKQWINETIRDFPGRTGEKNVVTRISVEAPEQSGKALASERREALQ